MNNRALRRALIRFQKTDVKPRQHVKTKRHWHSQCFEFGPDIERPIGPVKSSCPLHAVCTLKRNHTGPHCDLEHNIQWE